MWKQAFGSVLTVTGLVAGLVIGAGGVASAATCPSSAHPITTGGEASWTLSCSNGHLTVHGWVQDTLADNRCAYVTMTPQAERPRTVTACGSGVRKNFSEPFVDEYRADVRLRVA